MKKNLTTLFFLLMAALAYAVEIPVGYSKGIVASSSAYVVNGKGAVSAATKISPDLLYPYVGNEIRGISAGIIDARYCDSIRVFVSYSLNGEYIATGAITRKDNDISKRPADGWNNIPLNHPVAISEGMEIYIGYVFYQRYKCEAVSFVGKADDNRTYVKRGALGEWEDASTKGFVSVEMLIDGKRMPKYDFRINEAKGRLSMPGGIATKITVINNGQEIPSDFDLSFSADGFSHMEKISSQIAPSSSKELNIILTNVPDGVGFQTPLSVSVTRIAGGEDAVPSDNERGVGVTVKRNVVVEEFTGTGCGWCPRGLVGMDKLRKMYGNSFVGIGIHQYNSSDPMYPTRYKNLGFSGAPSCTINRTTMTDPYYGTDNLDICHDFENAMYEGAMASVTVIGSYNSDKTKVRASATISAQDNLEGLKLTFVLIADSLTGTTAAWKQQNYYASNYSASQLPDDMACFGAGGEYGQSSFFWIFNDVAIGTYYEGGQYEMEIGNMEMGQSMTIDYTLDMPTKAALINAIDYDDVAVIAMLLDGKGQVINAQKYYMDGRMEAGESLVTIYGNAGDLISGSDSDLSLYMMNNSYLNGFQLDLCLPEGVLLAKDEEDNYIYTLSDKLANPDNMQVNIIELPDNTYRIICFSFTNEVLPTGYDKLISLRLCTDENVTSGSYQCVLQNATCSSVDGKSIPIERNTFPLNVFVYPSGDVNHDESVNVTDVMLIVNHIMEVENTLFHEDRADVNHDNRIDVGDVMGTVKIILEGTSHAPAIARVATSDLRMTASENTAVLRMANMCEYTAFQMEVQMPEGVNLMDIDLGENTSSHRYVLNALGDGRYKVVVFSLDGNKFTESSDGALLRFITDSHIARGIQVKNIQFTNPSFETVSFNNLTETSGIEELSSDKSEGIYYDLQGIPAKTPSHGVYIKDGKKIIAKSCPFHIEEDSIVPIK